MFVSKKNLISLKNLFMLDLISQKKEIKNKLINVLVWVTCNAFVANYLFPIMGAPEDLTRTFIIGILAASIMFETYSFFIELVFDLSGSKRILYFLTLPIPKYIYFLEQFLMFVFRAFWVVFSSLVFIKLLSWNSINLLHINYFYLLIIFLSSAFFLCFISMFFAVMVKGPQQIGNIWTRFLMPMWLLGGFQFSWGALYTKNKSLALAFLVNPFIFSVEGYRHVFDSSNAVIPFLICLAVLIFSGLIFIYFGIKKMLKRLDCV
jgi:hypothetical protein